MHNDTATSMDNDIPKQSLLIFSLDGERFALDAAYVRETVWLPELSRAEELPPWVVGLFNLRGRFVSTIDLKVRFGHSAHRYHPSDQVVVLETGRQQTGLITSEVEDVVEINTETIQPLNIDSDTLSCPHLVTGEVMVGETPVAVLDIPLLLQEKREPSQAEHQQEADEPGDYFCPDAPPETRALFHQRAVALQNAMADRNTEPVGLAVVEIAGEYFGIELTAVQEFCSVDKVNPIPCCPSHILGAISLRGDLLTLLDPSRTFNLPTIGNRIKAVVGQAGDQVVALAVNEVHDAVYLPQDALRSPPDLLREQYGSIISAVAPYNDTMLTVLDLPTLLTREEWTVLDSV